MNTSKAVENAETECIDCILSSLTAHKPRRRLQSWSNSSSHQPPSMQEITQAYAPTCMDTTFNDLYRTLHPCLAAESSGKTNASAILQGPRGGGKSAVLDACLQAFSDELAYHKRPLFRTVRLNGILLPGTNIEGVVYEILRQLSLSVDGGSAQELLRLKQTSFSNHVQLLNEMLQIASVDGIPILFVLEELDAFVVKDDSTVGGNALSSSCNSRQLLLYHLLDRVAAADSLLAFVGMTSHQALLELLEKRIASRIEGTSKFFQIAASPKSFAELGEIVAGKFLQQDNNAVSQALYKQVCALWKEPLDEESTTTYEVWYALERSHRLGKSVRWFCRVFYLALSMHRESVRRRQRRNKQVEEPFAKLVRQALVDMGTTLYTRSEQAAKNSGRSMMLLKDLSGPQAALILASRRILAREGHGEQSSALTFDRMLLEYKSYRGATDRYGAETMRRAFCDLLNMSIVRPANDHVGTGPFQYDHHGDVTGTSGDWNTFGRVGLHLTLDIHRDVMVGLQENVLNCSTALCEWGKKMN